MIHTLLKNWYWEEAVSNYSRGIELYSKKSELEPVYYNRGRAYFELEIYDEARDDFEMAIKISRGDVPALYLYFIVGFTFQKLQQHEKAIHNFSMAIAKCTKECDKRSRNDADSKQNRI